MTARSPHPWLHDLEHVSFALVGLLVWTQMIDPAGSGRLRLPGRLAFTVAVFFAGQVLSDALVFSFHAYYPAYADQPGRLFGHLAAGRPARWPASSWRSSSC